MEREGARIKIDRPRCPFCHEAVGSEDAKRGCEECMAWHHAECWAEHGRCAACGFVAARRDELDDLPRLPELLRQLDDSTPGAEWEALARIGALGERAAAGLPELIERARDADSSLSGKYQETIAKVKGRFQRRIRRAEQESFGFSGCFETGIVVVLGLFLGVFVLFVVLAVLVSLLL